MYTQVSKTITSGDVDLTEIGERKTSKKGVCKWLDITRSMVLALQYLNLFRTKKGSFSSVTSPFRSIYLIT